MGCNPSKNHMEMYKIGDKFINDVNVKKIFQNPSDLVTKKFHQLFGFKPSEWKAWDPSKTDVKKFNGEIKYMLKQIRKGKIAGVSAANLYTTSGVVRRNPILGSLYDSFLSINHALKGRQMIDNQDFSKVLESLRDEATTQGMVSSSRSFKKAQKRAAKIEAQIEKLLIDQANGRDVTNELRSKIGELDQFTAKGEGKIFKDFINLIESKDTGLRSVEAVKEIIKDRQGKTLTASNIRDIKKAIVSSGITTSSNMQNALVRYIDMMHTGYNTLSRGVDAYINAMQEGKMAKGDRNLEKLNQIRIKMLDKLLPDEKVGYYPHFRYDLNSIFLDNLMPKLQKVSESTQLQSKKGISAAVDELDLYVSKRIEPRTQDLDNKMYSLNFPVTIKRYLDEINRFNFVSHTQMYTRRALREASEVFKKGQDLEGYGSQLVEMIKDLNHAQLGTREIQNPEWNNFSKAILNLEFTSKLGFNVRSGLRNATQGLLNFVEFGPRMMMKSKQFYQDREMSRLVDKAMEESGVRFSTEVVELTESGGANLWSQRVSMRDGSEKTTFKNPSKMSQFADMTGKIAGKSGVIMRNVENMNRKATYRLGFYKMYDSLIKNDNFREMMNEKFKGQMSEKQLESEIFRRSKNYAERMTTLLHFDYSTVSKSKLMRSPVGRFLFQFQHYGHKFAEYNFRIGRNAKHGLMAGEWGFGGEVGKAYRMGIAYFMVPALVSAITKNDIFRMIEHDTTQRVSQWWDFFTGDEEEFEKATYGRGAIGALIGAPVLSDALALGELAELWDLEDHEWLQMALGYNDMAAATNDTKLRKLANIVNVQAGRTFYSTSDLVFDGYLGRALTYEAGIFPTGEAADKQEGMKDLITTGLENMPGGDALLDALDLIDTHRKRARSQSSPQSGRVFRR